MPYISAFGTGEKAASFGLIPRPTMCGAEEEVPVGPTDLGPRALLAAAEEGKGEAVADGTADVVGRRALLDGEGVVDILVTVSRRIHGWLMGRGTLVWSRCWSPQWGQSSLDVPTSRSEFRGANFTRLDLTEIADENLLSLGGMEDF